MCDFPAPGMPITSTISPACSFRRTRIDRPESCSRSLASSSSDAARAADRAASGRRAPGMATTFGPRPSTHASATAASVAPRVRAISLSTGSDASRPARRGLPRGEWAMTASPRSAQRSTTPPRRAVSSKRLRATWTAAIGAWPRASSSCLRFTLQTPMRSTSPSSTSFPSARTDVFHGTRGSGAWRR